MTESREVNGRVVGFLDFFLSTVFLGPLCATAGRQAVLARSHRARWRIRMGKCAWSVAELQMEPLMAHAASVVGKNECIFEMDTRMSHRTCQILARCTAVTPGQMVHNRKPFLLGLSLLTCELEAFEKRPSFEPSTQMCANRRMVRMEMSSVGAV